MSSTPLSYQELLTLSQELSTTENIQKRARLIAQLIFTIEQGIPHPNPMDRLFFEKLKTRELAMTILEQNAAHIPIDEIIRMNFLGDLETSMTIQKIITIRRAEIPVTPFLDELLHGAYPRRHEAIQGLKALREYAPAEILLATIHDPDHIIAAHAAEAIVLREEPILLATLLEDFLNLHWYIQCAILDTTNQLNIPMPLEFLIYALHHPETHMHTAAVQGLGKHGKDAPIDIIENALQDGYTSMEALQALGAITEYKNYSLFTGIVHNPQKLPELRIEAAQILAHRGQYVPVQPLLTLLYDSNMRQDLRQPIQDLLEEISEAIVEDVLSYAYTSATITTQIAALQILSILDEPSFAGKLNEISSNRQLDKRLRRAAQTLLYHEDHDIRTQCLLTLLPDHPELMFTHLDTPEKNDAFTSNTELEDIFGL